MNELINLMHQIKDLSTSTNEIALIDLQPRLMAVYDKLEIERLSICDVGKRSICGCGNPKVEHNCKNCKGEIQYS